MTTTRQRRGNEHERATAAAFGGERIAGVGRRDVSCERWSIECKEKAKLPLWLTGAMEQAERQRRPDTVAVVVLHELHSRYDDDLVVLRRKEFIAMMEEGADYQRD